MALEIFAGPIVRTVSINSVYLWIATVDNPALEVSLFVNNQKIGSGFSECISLNDKIYVHLIKIIPSNGQFPTNKIISYSIGIPQGNGYDYEQFNEIVIHEKLAYNNEEFYKKASFDKELKGEKPNLPNFMIPPNNGKLNIAFGSCRKPHDKGEDAFVKIDSLIKSNIQNPNDRPHFLYLGGDQIYADDVHDSVITAIKKLSSKYNLIEMLPSGGATHTISYSDRSQVTKNMGFTSGEAKNHLLSFGEYVMMYGLVWNSKNWIGQEPKGLSDFLQSLEATRRVLANTPTYMIFDDHDVTDDWFITNKWKNNVLTNVNGKRVIANAMASYFLFQGWGNAPHKFNFTHLKRVIEERSKDPRSFDDSFLKLDWEFEIITSTVSYFLDTRTNRDGPDFPPLLKSNWGKTIINVANKNMPFVLVAPSPLLTFPGIDSAQEMAVKTGNLQYELDYESWFANKDNYKYFFDYFKTKAISKIIILSGDVHYGFSAIFTVYNKEKLLNLPGSFQLNCLQITSSALKNSAKLPLGFSLGINATVPYTGTLYYLFFKNSFEIACDKNQAESKVLLNRREKMLNGSALTIFPNYSVEKNKIYKFLITGVLPENFSYSELDPANYPDLIIELKIKSLSPKTADYIAEHNFGLVSINQNSIAYSFNNGNKYSHTL